MDDAHRFECGVRCAGQPIAARGADATECRRCVTCVAAQCRAQPERLQGSYSVAEE